jgi:periplasmic divalent cation tolerance protein
VDENIIMVIVTTSSKQEAQNIVTELLKKRLVACGNIIGPIFSSFWWKETIENCDEFLILMKTQMNLFKKVEHEILELHSYEIPEIVVLPITEGSKPYLDWVNKSLNQV